MNELQKFLLNSLFYHFAMTGLTNIWIFLTENKVCVNFGHAINEAIVKKSPSPENLCDTTKTI